MARRAFGRWLLVGPALILLILVAASGLFWHSNRSWRLDVEAARAALQDGQVNVAFQRLSRLAERRPIDGELLLLVGECELKRGRREEALAAWAKVPATDSHFPAAALQRATHLINSGRYTPAEESLQAALAVPGAENRYELERALSRLYRFQGRFDEVQRILRAAWCHANHPAGLLKELWLLDHSPMPVSAWQTVLEKADADDDRVWLGRANLAILTGDNTRASRWLKRCLERRHDDPAVWRAFLNRALAAGDPDALWKAAALLPGDQTSDELAALRAWLARQAGDHIAERALLTEVVQKRPGDTQSLERLAALASEAGDVTAAKEWHREKARIDAARDRFRKAVLDETGLLSRAGELAELASTLGRDFESKAWSLLALAGRQSADSRALRFDGSAPVSEELRRNAQALSAPFVVSTTATDRDRETLSAQLGDKFPDYQPRNTRVGLASIAEEAKSNAERKPHPLFVDDAESVGLRFTFDNGSTPEHQLPETMSGGVGLIDYDRDGWLDVYCVQGGSLGTPANDRESVRDQTDRLFRNRRDGTFEDVTDRAGLEPILRGRGYGLGMTAGDFDNDGYPDLFLTKLRTYVLLRNRGDGTFEDATERAGLGGVRDNPTSAAFADLDNDGDLDLYVCHYMLWDPEHPQLCRNDKGGYFYCDPSKVEAAPDHVFRNDGGRFTDVTAGAGFVDPDGRSLGVVAVDVNDDNRVDLFVSNDGTANYLFINLGGFRFEESALTAGVAGNASGGYQAGMGVASGDYDRDGRPDLMVTNFYGEGTSLYRNLGQGLFTDASSLTGIGLASRYLLGFGIAMVDTLNLGLLDVMTAFGHVNDNRPYYLYAMPVRLYQNGGGRNPKLLDVSEQSGAPWQVQRVGRGLAAGDLDNDGRVDALILAQNEPLAYFHNRTERLGHFLYLGLEGTRSNRDGVGAQVSIVAAGQRQIAQQLGGGSYQSANDPRLHFGLGAADRAESVEVRWPSGITDRWNDLKADTGYVLREQSPRPVPLTGFRTP